MQSINLIGAIGPVGIGTIGIGTFEMEQLKRRRDKGNVHSYLKMPKCETGWWFQSELRIHEHLELDQSPIRLQSGTRREKN